MRDEFKKTVKGLYPDSYNQQVNEWLENRYGKKEAETIWSALEDSYLY